MVVGAPRGTLAVGQERSGNSYSFIRDYSSSWVNEGFLLDGDPPASAARGSAVALLGDMALVGAPGDDHAGVAAGSASVQTGSQDFDTDSWNEVTVLTANDAHYNDRYGSSVAIGLDAYVIGAPGWPTGLNTGAVYVYPRFDTVTTIGGGTYGSTQSVDFECIDCTKVFYTTDGSTPSQTGGVADAGTLTYDMASPSPVMISTSATLTYFSIDEFNNEGAMYMEIFTIDNVAPSALTITTPADQSVTDSVTAISGTVTDTGGGDVLVVQVAILDDASGQYIVLDANGAHTGYSADPFWMNAIGTTSWTLPISTNPFVSTESYTIRARAVDTAIKISTPVSSQFTYYTGTPSYMELTLTLTSSSILNIPGNPGPTDPDYGKGEIDAIVKLTEPGVATEDQELSGKTIRLVITHPNGVDYDEISDLTVTDEGNLTFQDLGNDNPIDFDIEGAWTLQAFFDEELTRQAAASAPKTVLVGESAGSAVIIVGRAGGSNEGLASHTKTALRIYETLIARSFQPDDILFLSPDTDLDGVADEGAPTGSDGADCEDADGCNNAVTHPTAPGAENGIDGVPTLVASPTITGHINVQAAIEGLAPISSNKPAPRYVFFIDHGYTSQFLLTDTETITPTDLATWLDNMEAPAVLNNGAEAKPTVAVLGMCYSGSFLEEIATSTWGVDRVAISSAWLEESFKGLREPPDDVRVGEFFLEEFIKEAGRGASIADAFEYATELTELFTRRSDSTMPDLVFNDLAAQHPLLEDNGGFDPNDLAPNNAFPDTAGADGAFSRDLFLGVGPNFGTNASDFPADIVDVTDTVFLPWYATGKTMTLDAVNNGGSVSGAWIEVRVPDTSYTPTGLSVQKNPDLIKDALNPPLTGAQEPYNHWNVYFNQFSADEISGSGKNEVFYTLQDVSGTIAPIRRSVVYVNKDGNTNPTVPVLVSPGDGATIPTAEFFDWTQSTDPDGDTITYTLEITTDPTFTTVDHKIEEIPVSYYFVDESVGLQDLETYYWRVTAIDAFGGGKFTDEHGNPPSTSAEWSFDTDNSNIVAGGVFVTVSGNALDPVALGNEGIVTAYEAGTSNSVNPVAGSQAYQEETTTFYAKYPVDSTGYDFTVSGVSGYQAGATDAPTPISQYTLPTAQVELPLAADDDLDGLPNAVETDTGIYIDQNDTGTDPYNPDTDGDGLLDGEEVYTDNTDPTLRDSDGDGFGDGAEITYGSDPNNPVAYPPPDGDLAPLGVYDGLVNGADYLVAQRLALDPSLQTALAVAHGDVVTTGASAGVIDTADVLWILQQALNGP
jgi:hypothetical protein